MGWAIGGVRVGHWTDPVGKTGCTVVELPDGTTASHEVRGGAPASRELDLLAVDKTIDRVDAVVLTGGSAFGLAAADGVMRYYAERGRGAPTPAGKVPIVPTLALFDLAVGDSTARPTADSGYAAAAAAAGEQHLSGRIGAGTGAYVSQWRGPDGRRPGGLGHAVRRLDGVIVEALCAVNAFGDIDEGGEPSFEAVRALPGTAGFDTGRTHTTIGVVITNAALSKVDCRIVAQGAHDGLSRAIVPPHTRFDGDAFIAAATGEVPTHVDVVRLLALSAVAEAIRATGTRRPPPRRAPDAED